MIKYVVRYLRESVYHNKYDEMFESCDDLHHAEHWQRRLKRDGMKEVQIFKLIEENQTNDN